MIGFEHDRKFMSLRELRGTSRINDKTPSTYIANSTALSNGIGGRD